MVIINSKNNNINNNDNNNNNTDTNNTKNEMNSINDIKLEIKNNSNNIANVSLNTKIMNVIKSNISIPGPYKLECQFIYDKMPMMYDIDEIMLTNEIGYLHVFKSGGTTIYELLYRLIQNNIIPNTTYNWNKLVPKGWKPPKQKKVISLFFISIHHMNICVCM